MRAKYLLLAIFTVAILSVVPLSDASEADGGSLLIDMGNGETHWCDVPGDGSCVDAARGAAESLGLGFEASGDNITSIGGMENHSVGTQECSWRLYKWDGASWAASSDHDYSGGAIAYGFYPDPLIVPAETPDSPTAWTMHRGDSASSGLSDSHGTRDAVAPMEWYRTYETGYVDSAIVVAGNYLYHTTGGAWPGGNPYVYCVDRLTGQGVWEYRMPVGAGYEVTSPLVVGDMLIVTSTSWNVYCFDRLTGEVLDILELPKEFPMDAEENILWDGRTFYTGATTPVYDSGAVYFGTADGKICAYAVSRADGFSELWTYVPPSTVTDGNYTGTRGCFYFHAPVVTDVDGARTVFMGSYEGYLYALDASTGQERYVERLINLDKQNIPHPGTPGSVAGISAAPGGKLIVSCNDGGMSPQTGFTECIDASTGKGPGGSAYYWRLDMMIGGPVVADDGFYAYASTSARGPQQAAWADGTSKDIEPAFYKFGLDGKVLWMSQSYQLVKASLTLADGVLYANDYSAGEYFPSGGGVTAIDMKDGSEIWRLRLSPYSEDSYAMVSATVIDGKIYVGNDYGAVYCISETAGKQYGDEGEITLENGLWHWSWGLLVVLIVGSFVFLKKFY